MLRFLGSKAVISVSVSALFVVSMLMGAGASDPVDVTVEMMDDGQQAVAEWSVLVYLVADNDLDDLTEEDLQELRDGGSSDSVNVLMLVDRLYEPAYLYCIEGNEKVLLESLGEVNMGDPATLRWFVEYSQDNFPAERMLLFFWNHGAPTGGVGVDTTVEEGSEPGSDWDWLSHHELIEALEGHHVDIIAMDECSIGQMETVYEYVAGGLSVDYLVASQSYIGWRGFSYDKILQRLNHDPEMGARELSLVIVEEFTNLFSKPPYMCEILTTQSVFDMSKIPALGGAVTSMANILSGDIDSYRPLVLAAQKASQMPWGARSEGWIDMPTFVEHIMDNVKKGDPVYRACETVMDAYSEAMIGMGVTKNSEMFGYRGMGILFPPSHSMYTTSYYDTVWGGFTTYITYEFPNMGWWPFLEAYWGIA